MKKHRILAASSFYSLCSPSSDGCETLLVDLAELRLNIMLVLPAQAFTKISCLPTSPIWSETVILLRWAPRRGQRKRTHGDAFRRSGKASMSFFAELVGGLGKLATTRPTRTRRTTGMRLDLVPTQTKHPNHEKRFLKRSPNAKERKPKSEGCREGT